MLSFFQELLKKAINIKQDNLWWLKSRLVELSDVSSDSEVQRQQTALAKLSDDLQTLLSSLCQVLKWHAKCYKCICLQCLHFLCICRIQHEVIEEEAHDEMDEDPMKTEKTRSQTILDSRKVEEAKQLYLCHQVRLHLFSLLSEL